MQGLTNLDPFDPMGSLPAMGETLGKLEELDDADKQALADTLAAVDRLMHDGDGNLRDLDFGTIFSTSYKRQHTIGLSFSTILFDTVGLKFDSAISPKRTLFLESKSGFPMPASKPALSYSIGLDYRLGSWFDVMAEFYHFHVFLEPDEAVFLIGADLMMVTLASHMRFLDFDALEFQIAGMMEVNMLNLFLFPKVSYAITDGVRIALGAMIIEVLPGGDKQGPGGLYGRNDSIYGEFKWSF